MTEEEGEEGEGRPGGRAREIGRLVIPDRETTAFGYLLNYYDRMQRRGTTIHRRISRALNCGAQRETRTNGREKRGVQEAKEDEEEEEERSESNRECSAASEG
ncbi:hypothetical protein G5I_10025 [Acromyrmex echinatior]|uniref:Uncharacterized protein n=1 Tax=Acromyrmex echinatior TaxID=103372 RepID=F4WVS4_ACREC|nr:hypothetical protein G5I_10025 [Acromyrmex echinatior]